MSYLYLCVMCGNVRCAEMFALIVLSHAQSFAHIIQTISIAFILLNEMYYLSCDRLPYAIRTLIKLIKSISMMIYWMFSAGIKN